MSADPVAIVELPQRVPYGFHAFFVSEVSFQIHFFLLTCKHFNSALSAQCCHRTESGNDILSITFILPFSRMNQFSHATKLFWEPLCVLSPWMDWKLIIHVLVLKIVLCFCFQSPASDISLWGRCTGATRRASKIVINHM